MVYCTTKSNSLRSDVRIREEQEVAEESNATSSSAPAGAASAGAASLVGWTVAYGFDVEITLADLAIFADLMADKDFWDFLSQDLGIPLCRNIVDSEHDYHVECLHQ